MASMTSYVYRFVQMAVSQVDFPASHDYVEHLADALLAGHVGEGSDEKTRAGYIDGVVSFVHALPICVDGLLNEEREDIDDELSSELRWLAIKADQMVDDHVAMRKLRELAGEHWDDIENEVSQHAVAALARGLES